MSPSSSICRTQETFQRGLAASATLVNVRETAERAAAAWNKEAAAADIREQRELARVNRVKFASAVQQAQERHDKSMSENPDRGFVTSTVG